MGFSRLLALCVEMRRSKNITFYLSSFFLFFLLNSLALGEALPICKNLSDIKTHANTHATILGKFQKYTPNSEGKGKDFMFWDWEIVLENNQSIPMILNEKIKNQAKNFENLFVEIEGYIFYGIIIGSSKGQSMTGYRIDANHIQ